MFSSYPRGYASLFFMRLLGNFSFYGLKSILILYFTISLVYEDQKAFNLYGLFMSLSYLTPIIGGWLSDQFLGTKKSILIGGCFLFAGALLLSFSFMKSYYLGLSLISMGLGLFKPNAMSAVGRLFSDQDSKKRDSAYTTIYVGMNVGSLLGPLFCGWIVHQYGWEFVFPVIGLSMLSGVFLFYYNFKKSPFFEEGVLKNKRPYPFLVSFLIALGCVFLILTQEEKLYWLMPFIILGGFGCLGFVFFKTEGEERKNIIQISFLILLFATFASLFEQTGGSINLFIERGIDRNLFGLFEVPAPFFQSLNPAFVIFLGPLIAGFWIYLEKRRLYLSVFSKFALGFFLVSCSFLLLSFGIDSSSRLFPSLFWVLGMFFLQVLGELCIVPIGFSAVSKLSPKKFTTMVMGVWMVSIACGHYLAAFIASFLLPPLQNKSSEFVLSKYQDFFIEISFIPLIVIFLMGLFYILNKIFKIYKK